MSEPTAGPAASAAPSVPGGVPRAAAGDRAGSWTCGRASRPGPPCRTGSRSARAAARRRPTCRRCPPPPGRSSSPTSTTALTTTVLEETLPFRRWALICERTGDRPQQAEALLQAAWAADDAAAMTEAARLRTEVAALWDGTQDIELALRRLDVLRRAGLFERPRPGRSSWRRAGAEETARAIIAFQQARIAARDIGRHLISAALPPPATCAACVARQARPTGLLVAPAQEVGRRAYGPDQGRCQRGLSVDCLDPQPTRDPWPLVKQHQPGL